MKALSVAVIALLVFVLFVLGAVYQNVWIIQQQINAMGYEVHKVDDRTSVIAEIIICESAGNQPCIYPVE